MSIFHFQRPIKHYSERHELNLKSLYDWCSRLKKKDSPTRSVTKKAVTFAKVITVPPTPRTGVELRVGGVTLSVETLPDPEIHCDVHSSPLCNSLLATRRFISDDQFMLSQLDVQFNESYGHLKSAMLAAESRWSSTKTVPGYIALSYCCTLIRRRKL